VLPFSKSSPEDVQRIAPWYPVQLQPNEPNTLEYKSPSAMKRDELVLMMKSFMRNNQHDTCKRFIGKVSCAGTFRTHMDCVVAVSALKNLWVKMHPGEV
jgi:hypothetical protein